MRFTTLSLPTPLPPSHSTTTPMAATSAAFSPKFSLIRRFSLHTPLSSSPSLCISLSRSLSSSTSLLLHYSPIRNPRVLDVAENENQTVLAETESEAEEEEEEEEEEEVEEEEKAIAGVVGASVERKRRALPCELYVCNLPRSYDISHLLGLLNPYGTVLSVEVSRDPKTGISRGCGFVTMGSISEAKSAIVALDGSDVAGREMRVKFSVDMVSRRKNLEALNSAPKKSIIFESPYKIYVGNLSWSVRPHDLREHFSQFGTVVSTRVLHDRKRGKNRIYAFLSFATPNEVLLATEANGSKFNGRIMLVREVINQDP